MRRYLFISIFIALAMIICPTAALEKKQKNDEHKKESTQVISFAVQDDTEYISVMSTQSGEVSKIEMREYLIGCVAAEMPANYHPEALKAQAAVSYTYAMRTVQNANGDADITDDSAKHQGYINRAERQERWGDNFEANETKIGNAVDAVYGYEIRYNGETALTVYHSVSAGATQSANELWDSNIEYLQSVASPGDKLSPDYIQQISFSENELTELLNIETNESGIGKIEYTESGYVKKMEICGEEIGGAQIRDKLSLKSNCFDVEFVDGIYTFEVRGHGHGVGMSQYGADYMARQGSSWQEIIQHYYPGTEIYET